MSTEHRMETECVKEIILNYLDSRQLHLCIRRYYLLIKYKTNDF